MELQIYWYLRTLEASLSFLKIIKKHN